MKHRDPEPGPQGHIWGKAEGSERLGPGEGGGKGSEGRRRGAKVWAATGQNYSLNATWVGDIWVSLLTQSSYLLRVLWDLSSSLPPGLVWDLK